MSPPRVQIFQSIPEHVGFNIELKWICQNKVRTLMELHVGRLFFFFFPTRWIGLNSSSAVLPGQDGSWAENLSSYFNMNTFLDIILSCVLQKGGNRRIVFSCFDPDICIM